MSQLSYYKLLKISVLEIISFNSIIPVIFKIHNSVTLSSLASSVLSSSSPFVPYTNMFCKVTYVREIDVGFVHKEYRCHVTSKQANAQVLTDARSLSLDGSETHLVISISKETHIFGATVLYVW